MDQVSFSTIIKTFIMHVLPNIKGGSQQTINRLGNTFPVVGHWSSKTKPKPTTTTEPPTTLATTTMTTATVAQTSRFPFRVQFNSIQGPTVPWSI